MLNLLNKLTGKPNPFAPRTYGELHRVTDRVYIFRNITNSSFVIGDRGVAVVDTQVNHPLARVLIGHIRSVTDKPVLYAVNTHYHWDHTNGNQLFSDLGATVISSRLTREFMTTRYERQKEFLLGRGFEIAHDPMFPQETFDAAVGAERTLDLGGVRLRLFFAGKAESDDATAVHVEGENVLMAGDTVMTGSFPIFGQPVWDEGLEDTGQWEKTLADLLALKPAHIIPGHGPLAGAKETDLLLKIARYFVDEVRARVERGMELDAILKDMEPKLPGWITGIPVVWGNPRYAILRVWRSLQSAEKSPSAALLERSRALARVAPHALHLEPFERTADLMPGWQQFKPSAIPTPKKPLESSAAADLMKIAEEAGEGGDDGLRIAALEHLARTRPNDPDAHAALADALIEVSRKEDSVLEKGDFFSRAKTAWRRALEIDPEHVPSLLGKGRYLTMMAYRGGDDPEMGMIFLEAARARASKAEHRAEIDFYTGMGWRRLGNEVRAREFFDKSLAANPAFMPARMAVAG